MQIFKGCCLSKRKTVEAIANKAILRSAFKTMERKELEKIEEKDEMFLDSNDAMVKEIQRIANIEPSAQLTFFRKGMLYKKVIRLKCSKKDEDSFVKIKEEFYQVLSIFKIGKQRGKVLVEKIPIKDVARRKFKGHVFELQQFKVIDVNSWKNNKQFFIFDFREITSHIIFVKIEDVFENQYLIDIEV